MDAAAAIDDPRSAPVAADELRRLQQRSDARGLLRLAGHLAVIGGAGWVYTLSLRSGASLALQALAAVVLGFPLVTLFAAMHESVHRTAFESRWLNDSVGFFAGVLSFYNSSFYRPYHGWHHRFTQLPGQDPELSDRKPTSIASYLVELSGLPWWLGKLRTHLRLAAGKTGSYGFLNEKTGPQVVRSVRLQLFVYGTAIAVSVWLGYPYFLVYWLVPVAAAQPLLRAILLAEHMGCSESRDMLSNTRTTYTVWPVRFLMWEMPYHADHHRYPALPFFALASAHRSLAPYLAQIARTGYSGLHWDFVKALRKRPAIVHNPGPRGGERE
ncbi:MAG TPA: fatty acid desaturase [Polyangiaceae bacterium]|nr:fatty acid desaturase [Polyangiaceae bacterium]